MSLIHLGKLQAILLEKSQTSVKITKKRAKQLIYNNKTKSHDYCISIERHIDNLKDKCTALKNSRFENDLVRYSLPGQMMT